MSARLHRVYSKRAPFHLLVQARVAWCFADPTPHHHLSLLDVKEKLDEYYCTLAVESLTNCDLSMVSTSRKLQLRPLSVAQASSRQTTLVDGSGHMSS